MALIMAPQQQGQGLQPFGGEGRAGSKQAYWLHPCLVRQPCSSSTIGGKDREREIL